MLFFKRKNKVSNENMLINELDSLTNKEYDVFKLLVDGYKMRDIAELLNVKYSTINEHTKNIYNKLNIHSQKDIIIKYHTIFINKEVKK